ncbi:hypothetical protein FBY20_0072 [Achromobacter sp. SLBN-14]|nr:hypothetical protein FBY20_0072 [Achromobacter sp. SLBN-14]
MEVNAGLPQCLIGCQTPDTIISPQRIPTQTPPHAKRHRQDARHRVSPRRPPARPNGDGHRKPLQPRARLQQNAKHADRPAARKTPTARVRAVAVPDVSRTQPQASQNAKANKPSDSPGRRSPACRVDFPSVKTPAITTFPAAKNPPAPLPRTQSTCPEVRRALPHPQKNPDSAIKVSRLCFTGLSRSVATMSASVRPPS